MEFKVQGRIMVALTEEFLGDITKISVEEMESGIADFMWSFKELKKRLSEQ